MANDSISCDGGQTEAGHQTNRTLLLPSGGFSTAPHVVLRAFFWSAPRKTDVSSSHPVVWQPVRKQMANASKVPVASGSSIRYSIETKLRSGKSSLLTLWTIPERHTLFFFTTFFRVSRFLVLLLNRLTTTAVPLSYRPTLFWSSAIPGYPA